MNMLYKEKSFFIGIGIEINTITLDTILLSKVFKTWDFVRL